MLLRTKLFGTTYEFADIKELLAKANEQKSGDEQAGIAATSAAERVAARHVLAEVLGARGAPADLGAVFPGYTGHAPLGLVA